MIERSMVLSLLRSLYAVPGTDADLLSITENACLETESKMCKSADPGNFAILSLAAARANYIYELRKFNQTDGVTSFKAGDVSIGISPSAGLENAAKELSNAETDAASLLTDVTFVFMQVKP